MIEADPTLNGKVAVITGGSRGIGRAIADAYAGAGASIVLASRKLDACVTAAQNIAKAHGVPALGLGCHVGRWAECDALYETVMARFGRCDILVNNAGTSPLYSSLLDITEEYYDKVSAVNLKGAFRLGVLFGSAMAAGDGGSIINISTVASLRPGAQEIVYACAKAGLNALTIALSEAYGPKVRCNAILPGPVMTDISNSWSEDVKARLGENIPLGRPGYAGDYVGPALFLASESSKFVTGMLMRVDGGLYRQMS